MRILAGWLSLAALLGSCGSSSSEPASGTPTPAPAPAPAPAPVPHDLALHEWGLVDVDLARGVAELSAGPGQPARPVSVRKPVIYAHLARDGELALELTVRLAAGSYLEHWPAGAVAAETLHWSVTVRRGACTAAGALRDLPAAARGCASPDGFCELGELPRYVTTDHDCLRAGAEDAPLLFYRAAIPPAALPLVFEGAPDGAVRATDPGPGAGVRAVLRISQGLTGPWPAGRVVIARAERSTGPIALPVGDEVIDPARERAAMERALTTELHLTADEARAFLDAWAEELFGAPASTPAREITRRGPAIGARQRDTVLYWLSAEEIARIASLSASVPAAVHRAWLVRVELGVAATGAPAP